MREIERKYTIIGDAVQGTVFNPEKLDTSKPAVTPKPNETEPEKDDDK